MACALLIDDHKQLVESATAAAKARGLHLDTATDWDTGLALFETLNPDLVIADYNMPGSKHGLRLLMSIRRLRPSVRLILISGFLAPEDMAEVEQLGLVDRALTKGTSVESIRAILEEVAEAAVRPEARTDWVDFARAYVDAAGVNESDLDALDQLLAQKVAQKDNGSES